MSPKGRGIAAQGGALVVALGLALGAGTARAEGPDAAALLRQVEPTHPRHGARTWGAPLVDTFRAQDGAPLLVHQARWGGDLDHTPNLLKIWAFRGGAPKLLLDQNLDSVTFDVEGGALRALHGRVVETLCDLCGGWEMGEAADTFFIPVTVDVETLAVTADLDARGKRQLLDRMLTRARENAVRPGAAEREGLRDFIAGALARVRKLLGEKSPR